MAKKENDATYILDSKKGLPNKLLQADGTTTDMLGNTIVNPDKAWDSKPALPNKWLNPDGTYSTLNEIIASMVDTSIYVIVDELPAEGNPQKIYLVPDGKGGFVEYHWTGTKWDPVGMVEFDISNYSTTQEMMNAIEAAGVLTLNSAKTYADAKLVEAKAYTDQKAVTFKAFPTEFVTNGTTAQFLNSITAQQLSVGMAYLGQVSLSDMPDGVTIQAEVEVYIYPQNVAYCIMRSAEVSPYEWEVNSYENRGWEPKDKTAKAYADVNFLKKTNTTAYTPTADYHPSTKKYVDDSIATSITDVLGGSY